MRKICDILCAIPEIQHLLRLPHCGPLNDNCLWSYSSILRFWDISESWAQPKNNHQPQTQKQRSLCTKILDFSPHSFLFLLFIQKMLLFVRALIPIPRTWNSLIIDWVKSNRLAPFVLDTSPFKILWERKPWNQVLRISYSAKSMRFLASLSKELELRGQILLSIECWGKLAHLELMLGGQLWGLLVHTFTTQKISEC